MGASITAVSFKDYVLALIGIIPGVVLYVFLGASAGSIVEGNMGDGNKTITIVVIIVGTLFGIAAVAVTSYYAKQELNRIIAIRQAGEEEATADADDEINNI